MVVQLNGISGRSIQNTGSNSPVSKKGSAAGASAGAVAAHGGETVSLSNTAAQLQALEASIANLPIADMSLVESIQLALSTGEYHVNAEASAESLLEIEKKLP